MRLKLLMFLLPVLIFTASTRAIAQAGSLGDPVYTEDFGSGPNPGPALGAQYTNMKYTTGCPDDGYYTIVSSLNTSNNCHSDTWQYVAHDHTGNSNGYMMLINATQNPPGVPQNIFFTVPVPTGALCPNTTYEFSAYILNLINYSTRAGNIEPDIIFAVTTADGTPLATPFDTQPIPSNDPSNPNDPAWKKYSLTFTTPPNITSVIVSMTNKANGGNGNDLIIDDIAFRAYGPVVKAGFNDPNASAPSFCAGDPTDFTVQSSVQPGVFSHPSMQWQQNINDAGWMDVPGQTTTALSQHFNAIAAGNYQYRLGVAEDVNISTPTCRVYSTPLVITVYPKPQVLNVDAVQPPVCEGNTLTIAAPQGFTYHWTGPNNFVSDQNPLVINNIKLADAGPYTVTASSQYCTSAPFPIKVIVNPKPVVTAGGGTTICAGAPTTLTASGGTSYLWSPASSLSSSTSPTPIATPTDTTTYKVVVTNTYGCSDSAFVTVNVLQNPIANAGPDKVIFEGQSVKLSASAKYADDYSWAPTTGLSDPKILNPIASPTDDITYTLTATSNLNCTPASDKVFVRVFKKITIPNSFSPNNDGTNDLWDIDALITYPQSILTVFNRNGQQVYRTVGYSKPWDGKYNGQPVPSGTYYYVLDLKNNTPKISGWVVVVR